jgi:hypothetical protein
LNLLTQQFIVQSEYKFKVGFLKTHGTYSFFLPHFYIVTKYSLQSLAFTLKMWTLGCNCLILHSRPWPIIIFFYKLCHHCSHVNMDEHYICIIPTLWCNNKVIRHRKSRSTLHHSCFRHLVSDRLLSLISMENTRNVR